jgi:hypothetical protein
MSSNEIARAAQFSPDLERLVQQFESQYDAQDRRLGDNLRALIARSPDLKTDLEQAAAGPDARLLKFELFPGATGTGNAGAEYDHRSGTIKLSQSELANVRSAGDEASNDLLFKIGHEARHALRRADMVDDNKRFRDAVYDIATGGEAVRDYTSAVREFLVEKRETEAAAHLGGFNAIASMVREQNPKATLADVYAADPKRMVDFLEKDGNSFKLRPGLTVNEDLRMLYSKENIDAMQGYYFDQAVDKTNGLGPNRDWDNKHNYANMALEAIRNQETVPELLELRKEQGLPTRQSSVDFKALGLDPAKFDPKLEILNRPEMPKQTDLDAMRMPSHPGLLPLLDNPAHPNHGMYAKLLDVAQERDRALGRSPDEFSKQLASALTEQALARGLTTIGAAKFSDDSKTVGMTDTSNVYAEWAKTAMGNVGELVNRPLAQSSEGAAKLNEQIEQARTLQAQNQTQIQPNPDDPSPKGPKLS